MWAYIRCIFREVFFYAENNVCAYPINLSVLLQVEGVWMVHSSAACCFCKKLLSSLLIAHDYSVLNKHMVWHFSYNDFISLWSQNHAVDLLSCYFIILALKSNSIVYPWSIIGLFVCSIKPVLFHLHEHIPNFFNARSWTRWEHWLCISKQGFDWDRYYWFLWIAMLQNLMYCLG